MVILSQFLNTGMLEHNASYDRYTRTSCWSL